MSRETANAARYAKGLCVLSELEGDLLEALKDVLSFAERNHCNHSETHRGGLIWEICDMCGAKWADDEGGMPQYEEPKSFIKAQIAVSKAHGNP